MTKITILDIWIMSRIFPERFSMFGFNTEDVNCKGGKK